MGKLPTQVEYQISPPGLLSLLRSADEADQYP